MLEKCGFNIKPGSIIVFHDSVKAKPRIHTTKVLDYIDKNGFQYEVI
jgi:hypothetical protein